MHRILILVVVGATLVLATACSSAASGPDPDPTFTGGTTATAAPASSTAPAATSPAAAAPSTAPLGAGALPGVPAVTGSTDLTKQPVIAAGTDAPVQLVVRDLVAGTGSAVGPTATVNLKYVGALFSNGTVFDTSWGQTGTAGKDTAAFALSGVIPGFAQGLVGLKVGGRREIVIPPALGYAAQATGSIPANSTLVFVVDLVKTSG